MSDDRDDRSKTDKLADGLVGVALTCVWYFGGATLLIAGYPLWAAITVTIGALAFWRWRTRMLERRRQLPPVPPARLLDRARDDDAT